MAKPDPVLLDALLALIGPRRRGGAMQVVGIGGPQGSGKSTLVAAAAERLRAEGRRTAVLSLDDLYLARAERRTLARDVHPLLTTRGPPGTHDVALGLATLDALSRGDTRLPRFDKARDDRLPEADWEPFAGPADVVLFEGWCLGATPQPATALAEPVNVLERDEDVDAMWRTHVNTALARDYPPLFVRIDRLMLLLAPDFDTVLRWRLEQERALARRLAAAPGSGSAMKDAQVARFVQHYERLTRWIALNAPARADLVIHLDPNRRPVDPA